MTATYVTNGAICDATASQDTGALCTGIGVGGNNASPDPQQTLTAADFTAARIGDATAGVVYGLGSDYGASKGMRYLEADAAVANNAAITPSTYVNRTDRAMALGDCAWGVAP